MWLCLRSCTFVLIFSFINLEATVWLFSVNETHAWVYFLCHNVPTNLWAECFSHSHQFPNGWTVAGHQWRRFWQWFVEGGSVSGQLYLPSKGDVQYTHSLHHIHDDRHPHYWQQCVSQLEMRNYRLNSRGFRINIRKCVWSAAPVRSMDLGMYGTQTRSQSESETPFSGTGTGLPSHGAWACSKWQQGETRCPWREGLPQRAVFVEASVISSQKLETITSLLEVMGILVRFSSPCFLTIQVYYVGDRFKMGFWFSNIVRTIINDLPGFFISELHIM